MSVLRGGLTPVRTLDSDNNFTTQRFKKATDQNDASLVYVGDPVRLLSSGQVCRLLPADTSAAGGAGVLGVVARVLVTEKGRPRVHGLPDQHPNISLTSQADYLDVYIDPSIVYSTRIAGSASTAEIGQTVNVTTTARVTAAGISGTILDSTASASSYNPFKIIGISDFSLDTRLGDASGRVECIVNYGVFTSNNSF
jgi:hypothetical protein